MTREDLELDPEFFQSHQPLTLYRLARARYANLSGIGAAYAPGRWNRPGQEAIYTSTDVGTPVLERLVHSPKDVIPSNLALMTLRVRGSWEMQKNAMIDPATNGCFGFYRSLADARKRFKAGPHMFEIGLNPFAIAVPSVILPAWNVVLYPDGVGFWEHVSLESLDAFEFDPRLFPEDAMMEPSDQGQTS